MNYWLNQQSFKFGDWVKFKSSVSIPIHITSAYGTLDPIFRFQKYAGEIAICKIETTGSNINPYWANEAIPSDYLEKCSDIAQVKFNLYYGF